VSGLNVAPKNAKKLAEKIMEIGDDETKYTAYCQGAELRYSNMFTKEKMIHNIQEIYRKLWTRH
jgi:glycosyltransferase involved in cell wall biosynthesis